MDVYVYNPDSEDFSIHFDHKGEGKKLYTLRGLQMEKFPEQIAEHIKSHLADKIYEKRGLKNYPVNIQVILAELEVDLSKKPEIKEENGQNN